MKTTKWFNVTILLGLMSFISAHYASGDTFLGLWWSLVSVYAGVGSVGTFIAYLVIE